ncbi:MAG: cyclic nucleotide-binding domain-containing protein, partial [Deltaproteobacteria bacterium]|nr:cyclic nucleotide-binding domain-containing protein [Deltaproteobacteria bacterium]
PDVVKRFQQVGYIGKDAVTTFVLVDSKQQGESISWNLVEFPILYALYFMPVEHQGRMLPAFYAGKKPLLAGLEEDVRKAMIMVKYGNYGVDSEGEFDAMDIPTATRDALRKEILGLAVHNRILESDSFLDPVYLDRAPRREQEFSDLGDGIRMGRLGYNRYRFLFHGDTLDVDVSLRPGEHFRSPVDFKHIKFPVVNFGVWHTGEYDGMDPYHSAAHTTLVHKYAPVLVDYPSNMTKIITHHGLSQHSVNTVLVTHNHDDHTGALVELFRRSQRCHIITTDPVRYSLVKKLSAMADLPERMVQQNFDWTLLPFRKNTPYQTETLNLEGLQITGHLSCHSVPTTVFTLRSNQDGYPYHYGHFLDIVAFRRMEQMVRDGWMPKPHLKHLDQVIRKTPYSLIKYDVGCAQDSSLNFTVHGQWQDLISAATEKAFRVFSHATRADLNPAYENTGRFVNIGDLDFTIREDNGRLSRLGSDKSGTTAFFSRARDVALGYFESLLESPPDPGRRRLMEHYASAFANCPKLPDPNVGAFIFDQGTESVDVLMIVRGQAERMLENARGLVTFRSLIGDGEVVGDLDVLSRKPRAFSVRSLNRISYLAVPASLFLEAMETLGVSHSGSHKEFFVRRSLLQSARELSQDVSLLALNHLARHARLHTLKKGDPLFLQGSRDATVWITSGAVAVKHSKGQGILPPGSLLGECEYLAWCAGGALKARRMSAVAAKAQKALCVEFKDLAGIPVFQDNARRILRARREDLYLGLPPVLPGYGL